MANFDLTIKPRFTDQELENAIADLLIREAFDETDTIVRVRVVVDGQHLLSFAFEPYSYTDGRWGGEIAMGGRLLPLGRHRGQSAAVDEAANIVTNHRELWG